VKGPIAKGAYWFNQKGLDGVINGAGSTAVKGGKWLYDKVDQGVIEGAVNGSGRASFGTGGGLRTVMQTGRVQQYAALLFFGAAALAAVFIIVI
jgi:hypothetical protein